MSNELYHYGVLGMKWGVRRDRSRSGGSRRKRPSSQDSREASAIKKKRLNEMSNAELRKFNERTRLEQEYSRLNPNAVKKGWKYVATAVGVMGTAVALYNNSNNAIKIGKEVGNKVIDTFGNAAINEILGRHR